MSRKNLIRVISVIYWLIILGTVFVDLYFELPGELSLDMIGKLNTEQLISMLLTILFMFLFKTLIVMFSYLYLTIFYFGGIAVLKKHYKEKVDITDKKNDNYYRNLLKDYPIGVLGYIKDFNIDDSEIVGTILFLELKDKIEIGESIIIKNTSSNDLSLSESYVLECLIKHEKISLINFSQNIKDDAKNYKLLIEKDDYKKQRNKMIIKAVIGIVFLSLVTWLGVPIYNTFIKSESEIVFLVFVIILFCSVLLGFLVPFIMGVKIISYSIVTKLDPYVRSKTAMELNEKMNGLSNFLKDFSTIHERKSEELKLWKEYLIYSVIFEQNENIEKEILMKI